MKKKRGAKREENDEKGNGASGKGHKGGEKKEKKSVNHRIRAPKGVPARTPKPKERQQAGGIEDHEKNYGARRISSRKI